VSDEGTQKEFQRFVGGLDYPLFVVTVADGDERDGCIVGFTTQCSIDPPLFLVCVSDKNRTWRIAQNATALGVHLVPHDRHDLAELFGGETADERDKLAEVDWSEGPGGVPLIEQLTTRFVGKIVKREDYGGDHTCFLLSPVEAESGERPDELSFQQAKDIEPGHEP
jgi:flavin reductase (DIM6/NTAB) family NADH-FMN oxidoreductase RutF